MNYYERLVITVVSAMQVEDVQDLYDYHAAVVVVGVVVFGVVVVVADSRATICYGSVRNRSLCK